jgi:hypothetical protein
MPPAAAKVARKMRRVGDGDTADMIIVLRGGHRHFSARYWMKTRPRARHGVDPLGICIRTCQEGGSRVGHRYLHP